MKLTISRDKLTRSETPYKVTLMEATVIYAKMLGWVIIADKDRCLVPDWEEFPRIPSSWFWSLIHDLMKYKKEVTLVLYIDTETKEWSFDVPDQSGSGASCHYVVRRFDDNREPFGTIHTHPNMSAFHSGTDHHDESGENNLDGVHFVLGFSEFSKFQISGVLTCNGARSEIDIFKAFDIEEIDLSERLKEASSAYDNNPVVKKDRATNRTVCKGRAFSADDDEWEYGWKGYSGVPAGVSYGTPYCPGRGGGNWNQAGGRSSTPVAKAGNVVPSNSGRGHNRAEQSDKTRVYTDPSGNAESRSIVPRVARKISGS